MLSHIILPIPELKKIMGSTNYKLLTIDYVNIAYDIGDNKQHNIDLVLTNIVTKLIKWYSSSKNKKKMCEFMDAHTDENCYVKPTWREFKAMFIDTNSIDNVIQILTKFNTGYISRTLNSNIKQISVYQLWSGQVKVTTNNLTTDVNWSVHYVY